MPKNCLFIFYCQFVVALNLMISRQSLYKIQHCFTVLKKKLIPYFHIQTLLKWPIILVEAIINTRTLPVGNQSLTLNLHLRQWCRRSLGNTKRQTMHWMVKYRRKRSALLMMWTKKIVQYWKNSKQFKVIFVQKNKVLLCQTTTGIVDCRGQTW